MLRLKILTQRLTQRTNVTIPALKPFQMHDNHRHQQQPMATQLSTVTRMFVVTSF